MKYAAFFRNLNLGRPNCPTRAQFEAAFLAAGAASAASFLTNGTLVFEPAAKRARALLSDACRLLRDRCGLREPAFLRSVDALAALAAADPFAGVDRTAVYECCVTFLPTDDPAFDALRPESKRRDVHILQCTGMEALSVSLRIGNTPGSPNAYIEKQLGRPTTTRSWSTVTRLLERHA